MAKKDNSGGGRKSRKRAALIVLLVLLIIVSGIAYAANKLLTGPSNGTIVNNLPVVSSPSAIELQQFDGTHFSFVHPMTYVEQKLKPEAAVLESRSFVSSGMLRKVLTAAVTSLPSGKLEDDPSYTMRQQNPDKYQMKYIVVKNERVAIATSVTSQEFQQTAFWPHGGKLLTFTMTGVTVEPKAMAAEHEAMVNSVSWL